MSNTRPTIKTLADLRRIPVGTKLRLVASPRGVVNQLRTVDEVTTRGVWMTIDEDPTPRKSNERSWFAFPKARDFAALVDGFTVTSGDATLRYVVEADAIELPAVESLDGYLRVTSMTADDAKAFIGRADEPVDLGEAGPGYDAGAHVWGFYVPPKAARLRLVHDDDAIRQLRTEAARAGDHTQALICDLALGDVTIDEDTTIESLRIATFLSSDAKRKIAAMDQDDARVECERVLRAAAAQTEAVQS